MATSWDYSVQSNGYTSHNWGTAGAGNSSHSETFGPDGELVAGTRWDYAADGYTRTDYGPGGEGDVQDVRSWYYADQGIDS